MIWTGANDGPFHVTRDNGKTWTNVTPKDLPPGGRVQWIDASPHRRGSAYFAVYRYLLGDYAPYIYRTDDYGRTWTRLTDGKNGIPADWPTRVVREDPDREGLLYAGTEFGMFISFDNGAHWQPFQLNMPNVPITDIKVHQKDLVVATQGRALWILDNLSALHQVTPQVERRRSRVLFKPRDGYRTRTAPNMLGPTIEYYLPSEPAGPVTIEILDAAGAVVNTLQQRRAGGRRARPWRARRRAVAAAEAARRTPDDPDAPMLEGRTGRGGGGGGAARVTKTAGLNRFVWNVQHSSGLGAPPGAYQARLTVDGTTLTQPFTVLDRSAPGGGRADRRRHQGAVRSQPQDARARRERESVRDARARGADEAAGRRPALPPTRRWPSAWTRSPRS